jgi:hypothetical protein
VEDAVDGAVSGPRIARRFQRRIQVKARISLIALLALPLAGCASQLHGTWMADGTPPAGAKCTMQSMEFKDDGTFTASANVEGKAMPMEGKYKYNGCKLMLDASDGKHREYDACIWMGSKMKVVDKEGDKSIEQWFKKETEKKEEPKSGEMKK